MQTTLNDKKSLLSNNRSKLFGYRAYTFTLFKEEHIIQATELFIKTFCDEEPMTRYLKITYDEYRPFVEKILAKAVDDKLSIVALYNDKVVAINIIEDLSSPLAIDFVVSEKLQKIFSLLDDLTKPFIDKLAIAKNRIAHYFIAAIDEKHRGIGLSKAINIKSNKYIHNKGYDFILAELTNEFSQRNAKDYSFVKLAHFDYAQYELNGEKPFKGLPGYAAFYIGIIRPQAELIYKEEVTDSNLPYTIKSRL